MAKPRPPTADEYMAARKKTAEQVKASTQTTPGDEERKARIKTNGLECLRRIHGDQTWEDWRGAGAALVIFTEEAMAAVEATEWNKDNRRLVKEFNKRWDAYEGSLGSNFKPISKQERWALREVMTNPKIEAWRAKLDGYHMRRLNHPNAVLNKWRSTTETPDQKAAKAAKRKKRQTASSLLSPATHRTLAQLEAENGDLKEDLASAREAKTDLDLRSDSYDELAHTIVMRINDDERARKLANAILGLLKDDPTPPGGKKDGKKSSRRRSRRR
jgi:hypothetical protein